MGKPFHYIILVFVLLGCFSCKRHVCPTYFSAFNIEKGGPEKFFNYFEADTAKSPVALKDTIPSSARLLKFEKGENPMDDRMFKSNGRNINGLVNQKGKFLNSIFKKRAESFMKVVRAKITISEIDSAEAAELYAVSDPLFDPDRFKRDQYIYMELFGNEILDSIQAQNEREQARLDTLNEEDLPRKERKALKKQRKKEYKRLKKAAKRGEIEQSVADAYYEEYLAKPKKEKKKKKGDDEQGADDGDTGAGEPDDEKKKKKRGKKKEEIEDSAPPDDEGP